MVNRRPLLGRLAALGWFTQNGEVAATQALTMLLDDDVLHHAFVSYAEELTGTALPGIHVFEAERSHEGFGRPDIEGVDTQRHVVVIVEGKFWAPLGVEQVQAYLTHLRQNRSPGRRTAFLVLLPECREGEARRVVATASAMDPAVDGGATDQTLDRGVRRGLHAADRARCGPCCAC